MYPLLKRAFDILFSLLVLLFGGWLYLIIALVIRVGSPGPVLFRQERVGLRKRNFQILKFRTMRADAPRDTPTHMLRDPQAYITPVGRWLRRTSLDELPQVFNILRGQMSVVGPRPALWNQADLIAERDKYGANDVPPGLTGWAQVNGRDELPIAEKAKLDGYYVAHRSLGMDLRILLRTVGSVLSSDGGQEGAAGSPQNDEHTDCNP